MPELNFFISYASADRIWAEWIAWQLEEAGYKVKIQAWDFSPGGNFVIEMHKSTVEFERTIAVFPRLLVGLPKGRRKPSAESQFPRSRDARVIGSLDTDARVPAWVRSDRRFKG